MPDGIMMFAPTKLVPLATTTLYSWPAKFRMALDWFLPRRVRWAEGETAQAHDETLESFVVRRMGRESLDRLAEPLVGGVHASDPGEMSLAATFPNFLEMEQQFGSVIRGFLNERKKREEMRRKYPPKPGAKPWAFFNTFQRGMQELTDGDGGRGRPRAHHDGRQGDRARALRRRVAREPVDGRGARGRRGDRGDRGLGRGGAAPRRGHRGGGAAGLDPVLVVGDRADGVPAEDCPSDLKWFGILSPIVEGRPLLAVTLSSSKWPDRAPEDRVLFRGFVGGPRNQHLLEMDDAALVETVRAQIVDLLGMSPDAQPVFASVYRWNGGMPQYTLGHLDRVDEIERRSAGIPGLALAGGAFRGVGVPTASRAASGRSPRCSPIWGSCSRRTPCPRSGARTRLSADSGILMGVRHTASPHPTHRRSPS